MLGRVLTVRSRRYDRQNAFLQQFGSEGVAVVALVGQHQARLADRDVKETGSALVIGSFAAGHEEAERAFLTVHSGVDFRRKAAAASTKALRIGPPFAPAACE